MTKPLSEAFCSLFLQPCRQYPCMYICINVCVYLSSICSSFVYLPIIYLFFIFPCFIYLFIYLHHYHLFFLSLLSISLSLPLFLFSGQLWQYTCQLSLEGDIHDLPSITLRQWRFRLCSGEVIQHLVASLMIVQKLLRCLIPGQYGWTSFQVCSGGFNSSSCLSVY